MHALIIESEFFTGQVIEDSLCLLGYTSFAIAVDEEQAIAAATERCPDLITADVQLIEGCGIGAVQSICQEKPIPVLYITALALLVRERCAEAVIIQKPFSVSELRDGVELARRAA